MPAEVMDAGPPLPSHHWQVLRGTERHTPQFTKLPEEPLEETWAGFLHHSQTPELTHLHTPQSTAPATPQEAMDRPRSVPLVLLLAKAWVKVRARSKNLVMACEGERLFHSSSAQGVVHFIAERILPHSPETAYYNQLHGT
ncbi:unnamed protein product [Effrenium voratum]|nr:unnamed protein product [Effrenium voratum]